MSLILAPSQYWAPSSSGRMAETYRISTLLGRSMRLSLLRLDRFRSWQDSWLGWGQFTRQEPLIMFFLPFRLSSRPSSFTHAGLISLGSGEANSHFHEEEGQLVWQSVNDWSASGLPSLSLVCPSNRELLAPDRKNSRQTFPVVGSFPFTCLFLEDLSFFA